MGAVMSQVQKVEGTGDKDMEEAINDFAGKAGVDDKKADKKPTPPPKPRKRPTASSSDTASAPAENCSR